MEFQDLRKNINLKILSLVFAILLWAYVSFVQNALTGVFAEVDITGIEINNIPKNAVVLDLPDKATVKIKGSPKVINNIRPDEFKAYVDLSGKKAGENVVKINVDPPPGVEIVDIIPKTARLNIDRKDVRSFAVKTKTIGSLPVGYNLGNISLSANNVLIEGPKTELDKIKDVYVMPSIQDAKIDFVQKIEPAAYNINGVILKNVDIKPNFIFVTVSVKSNLATKLVPVEAALSGSVKNGFEIDMIKLYPLSVMVQAPQDIKVEKIFTKNININNLDKNYTTEVDLEVPEKVNLLTGGKVKLEIVIKPR